MISSRQSNVLIGVRCTEGSMSSASLLAGVGAPAAGVKLSRRSGAVALLAVAVVALAFSVLPLDRAVVAASTGAVLVVLAAIDIDRRIIPNRIVLPATAIVLLEQIVLFPGQTLEWVLAAVIAAAVFILPQLLGRAWMGMGDVKLVLLLGVALGWGVLGATLIAFVCVLPVALVLFVRQGLGARKSMVPFGPLLALGALAVLLGPALAGLPTS
jgi:leader peptidase (prepilin peptidase) / N-methyltransferase